MHLNDSLALSLLLRIGLILLIALTPLILPEVIGAIRSAATTFLHRRRVARVRPDERKRAA